MGAWLRLPEPCGAVAGGRGARAGELAVAPWPGSHRHRAGGRSPRRQLPWLREELGAAAAVAPSAQGWEALGIDGGDSLRPQHTAGQSRRRSASVAQHETLDKAGWQFP